MPHPYIVALAPITQFALMASAHLEEKFGRFGPDFIRDTTTPSQQEHLQKASIGYRLGAAGTRCGILTLKWGLVQAQESQGFICALGESFAGEYAARTKISYTVAGFDTVFGATVLNNGTASPRFNAYLDSFHRNYLALTDELLTDLDEARSLALMGDMANFFTLTHEEVSAMARKEQVQQL